jgi:hypothetical protein
MNILVVVVMLIPFVEVTKAVVVLATHIKETTNTTGDRKGNVKYFMTMM